MSLLHVGDAHTLNASIEAGENKTMPLAADTGLHAHIKANVSFQGGDGATGLTITLRDGDNNSDVAAHGSVAIGLCRTINGTLYVAFQECSETSPKGATLQLSRPDGAIELEIFVDGPLTELFANGGERSLTTSFKNADYFAGTNLRLGVTGAERVAVQLSLWGMAKSVR